MAIIIGIDPGSRILGYGVIEAKGDKLRHLAHDVIDVSRHSSFSLRLKLLSERLGAIIEEFRPNIAVVEKIFLGKNVDSVFKLGHARGVCVLEAARRDVPVFEYEARVMKKGITGDGGASKEHVRLITLSLLGISSSAKIDATDALSMACYHARVQEVRSRFEVLKIDPPSDLGQPL